MKAGHRGYARRSAVARAGASLPHAGTDPRQLVVEFDARGPLAPAAAATAVAVVTPVECPALAAAVGVETQPEDPRAVGERVDVQPAGRSAGGPSEAASRHGRSPHRVTPGVAVGQAPRANQSRQRSVAHTAAAR